MQPEKEILAPLLRTASRLKQRPQTYLTELGKVQVENLRLRRRRGEISDEELMKELDKLGMPAEMAMAIVENERLRSSAD